MAKIEPGSASPDGFFEDIDDGEDEGSRLPLLIVIALLVLAAFGGVVWLAYNQGLQKGRADAPRPLMAQSVSPSGPKGIKVYEQPAPPDSDSGETDSVPPPPDISKPSAPTPAPAATPAPKPAVSPPPAANTMTAANTPPPARPATAAPKPLQPAAKPVEATPKPVLQEATPPAQTPAPAASPGSYVLQIGAYKSEAEAAAAWKAFRHKHALLAAYAPDVMKVDLGEKGTWYRLRAGAFATRDEAASLCAKLKADGGDCLLAKK
ncbi:MAG: SPOR domain-containing protein [Rhizomicrobium sp.]